MDTLQKIDRFGLRAITGRDVFFFGELRRLIFAENIVTAFQSRARSNNWAEWMSQNPTMANLLNEAEQLCQ